MAHAQPHVLLTVLLTCERCQGATTVRDDEGSLNACHHCINGYRAVALPLEDVLSAVFPEPARNHAYLLAIAADEAKVYHPLLHNVTDVPTRLQRWLLNNPSDKPDNSK